jgi:hypothetical protein
MRVAHSQDTASRKLRFATDKTQPVNDAHAGGHGHVTDEQVQNALRDHRSEQFEVA